MTEYPPSGVLFANKKKTKQNSPDYTGNLELSDEVVNDLVCLLYTSPSPRD